MSSDLNGSGGGDFPFFSDYPFSFFSKHNSNQKFDDEPLPCLDPCFSNDPNLATELTDYYYNYNSNNNQLLAYSYSGAENVSKYIQRSFGSNCFEEKSSFVFQTHHDSIKNSFENRGQMRRVCSTSDLQNMKANQMSPTEEANLKVGRYSDEVRKERISKYRAKRAQRNFNKTIKYACRKTLADNRTRVRGRFARNDEPTEIPKAPPRDEEEEFDFWMEELQLHEYDDVTMEAAKQYFFGSDHCWLPTKCLNTFNERLISARSRKTIYENRLWS